MNRIKISNDGRSWRDTDSILNVGEELQWRRRQILFNQYYNCCYVLRFVCQRIIFTSVFIKLEITQLFFFPLLDLLSKRVNKKAKTSSNTGQHQVDSFQYQVRGLRERLSTRRNTAVSAVGKPGRCVVRWMIWQFQRERKL